MGKKAKTAVKPAASAPVADAAPADRPLKVLMCVPAYGGSVRIETMRTVSEGMISILGQFPGTSMSLMCIDLAEIGRVRNMFASALLDQGHDVAFMVDADMSFPAGVFAALLKSEHEVCGLTYPKRQIDLEAFYQGAQSGLTLEECRHRGLTFIAHDDVVLQDGKIEIRNGFTEMRSLPGGCLMIRRSAVERIAKEHPELIRQVDPGSAEASVRLTRVVGCFDAVTYQGKLASEDISFCHRWRAIGGKVMVLADIDVNHHGQMAFQGNYFKSLALTAKTKGWKTS
jgi:hypothetical protein